MEPRGSSLRGAASYFSCLKEHKTHVCLCRCLFYVLLPTAVRPSPTLSWKTFTVSVNPEITSAGVGICHGPPEALRDCISLSRRSSSAAFLSSSSCLLNSSAVPCGCSYTHLQTHANTCGQSTGMHDTLTNLFDSTFGINGKPALSVIDAATARHRHDLLTDVSVPSAYIPHRI